MAIISTGGETAYSMAQRINTEAAERHIACFGGWCGLCAENQCKLCGRRPLYISAEGYCTSCENEPKVLAPKRLKALKEAARG